MRRNIVGMAVLGTLLALTFGLLNSPLADIAINRSSTVESAFTDFAHRYQTILVLILVVVLLLFTNGSARKKSYADTAFILVLSLVGAFLGTMSNQAIIDNSSAKFRSSNVYSLLLSEINLPRFSTSVNEPLPFVANLDQDRVLIGTSSNLGWVNSSSEIDAADLRSNISVLDASGLPTYSDSYDLPGLKAIRGIQYSREKSAVYVSAITKENTCVTLSLFKYPLDKEKIELHNQKRIYQSSPCLSGRIALQNSGGRLALDNSGSILLAVGDFGLGSSLLGEWEGQQDDERPSELEEGDYGKTFSIADSGESIELSRGHRNPQGITQDQAGNVWISEHGPKGGDELNMLTKNADYGWPIKTYGAPYYPDIATGLWDVGSKWMSNQDGFDKPVFSWFPSIAPSQLSFYSGKEFLAWKGSLIMGTLKDEAIHRLYLQDGRVAYDERIQIGSRIRDLKVLWGSGKILVSTDERKLILISRAQNLTE